jgi:plastocyanin
MEIIYNIRRNFGRMALMGTLAALMIVGLAACGGRTGVTTDPSAATAIPGDSAAATNTPDNSNVPPATSTPDTSSAAGATSTPDAGMGTMETPTQAPGGTTDLAPTPTQAATSQTSGGGTQINATLKEWAIDLSQSQVPAGKVTFSVTNAGQMGHNLTVLDSSGTQVGQTPLFRSTDGPQALEVNLTAGTYTIICSLPGHAARGQKTVLVVK